MSKSKGLQYTAGEKQVIDSSWFTLMRAVEHSSLQENRLLSILRTETKEFGRTSAKALILSSVVHGLRQPGPETLNNVVRDRDEKLIGYCVGVYLRSERDHLPEGAAVLIDSLSQGITAWNTAHARYLESVK